MEIQTQLQEMIKYYNDKEGHEKHLKGYMFDSLVYRYQLALYKASLQDAREIAVRECISKTEAEAKAKNNYTRDLMRFIQILDEAIGEHD
jgi:hypothetical protein